MVVLNNSTVEMLGGWWTNKIFQMSFVREPLMTCCVEREEATGLLTPGFSGGEERLRRAEFVIEMGRSGGN